MLPPELCGCLCIVLHVQRVKKMQTKTGRFGNRPQHEPRPYPNGGGAWTIILKKRITSPGSNMFLSSVEMYNSAANLVILT